MSDPSHQLIKLDCDQLVKYLEENGFAADICQTFKSKFIPCMHGHCIKVIIAMIMIMIAHDVGLRLRSP